jgi:hypothetical protein
MNGKRAGRPTEYAGEMVLVQLRIPAEIKEKLASITGERSMSRALVRLIEHWEQMHPDK